MLYDINPVAVAAGIRLDELRQKAVRRRLIQQLNRQRRQTRARQLIALGRRALDALDALLDERAEAAAPQQAIR